MYRETPVEPCSVPHSRWCDPLGEQRNFSHGVLAFPGRIEACVGLLLFVMPFWAQQQRRLEVDIIPAMVF